MLCYNITYTYGFLQAITFPVDGESLKTAVVAREMMPFKSCVKVPGRDMRMIVQRADALPGTISTDPGQWMGRARRASSSSV